MAEPGRFTIDASVFVSALRDTDPAHGHSVAFLGRASAQSLTIVPNLPHDITALHPGEAFEA